MTSRLKQRAWRILTGIACFAFVLYFIGSGSRVIWFPIAASAPVNSEKGEPIALQRSLTQPAVKRSSDGKSDLPIIYVITPTYSRPVQKAELTRFSHTLMLVPRIHWIVIEDSDHKTNLVKVFLMKTGIPYTHLAASTPTRWKQKEPNWKKHRGVLQRNTALEWIRNNLAATNESGVLFFADDDNTYSLEIFDEMRHTERVSVWPVGLVGGLMVERPLLNETGHVVGWNSVWRPDRPFPVDMAGFGVNLRFFLSKPQAKFSYNVERGFQESELLRHLVNSWDELEPKADRCTKVYVWHTRTEKPVLSGEDRLRKAGKRSDAGIEV
ncbi:galactosylgalactosylxylosylprotein 3-beta-glucuronosyltransferase I-like isoform X1 [Schistocerca americana]|uniref:galactosylgalactosylxylosylprotein 3-beta-glucuronosyltransferase I-like isoform X1 n=1 Tax=Schistocerca americana TaxID=7009 RepID=UPI001F503182|nr:galactosylgalactosylxylosylprotein 3-beta-glucuronosyltransferase I-like isoform X1 [Schistocerca americana]